MRLSRSSGITAAEIRPTESARRCTSSATVTIAAITAGSGAPRTRSIETWIAAPPGTPPIAAAGMVQIKNTDDEHRSARARAGR